MVISGDIRVDSKKLSCLIEENVKTADAEEVRKSMGYVIGGVPPFPPEEEVRGNLYSSLQRVRRGLGRSKDSTFCHEAEC